VIPLFLSKRGHVTGKHVLTGRKHDMLGNQTFEDLRPLSKLSHQYWKAFEFVDKFSIHKYCRNVKPGILLSKDFRNEVIQIRVSNGLCEHLRACEQCVYFCEHEQ